MSESDVRKLEDEITTLKAENNLLRQQLAAKEEKIEAEVEKRKAAEVNLDYYKGVTLALELQLSGRGSIDTKEEEILPLWVRNLNLSRSQRWHLTIHFKLTHEAELLAHCLQQMKIEPVIFASKIERLYHKWGRDHHGRKLEIPVAETGWNEMFRILDISERLEKSSVRALLEYDAEIMNEQSLCSSVVETPPVDERRGFLVLKNISFNAKINEFKRHLLSQNVPVLGIVMLMTQAEDRVPMQSAGMVVVYVENVEDVKFLNNISGKYCAPGKRIEIEEKIFFGEY